MKKIICQISLIALSLISVFSCSDFLDSEYIFKDKLNIDSVFARRDYSERWLAGVYSKLAIGANIMVASKGEQPFNFLGDDMFFGDRDNDYEYYKNCRYDESKQHGAWNSCYEGIRDASIFINNIDKNRELSSDEIADWKAQARFVRGYLYWLLIRKYGPVPILPDAGLDYNQDYAGLAVARTPYTECVEFIAKEMALAAQVLPTTRTSREVARATRGAALAIRARAYLYAASPLFNGNTSSWAAALTDNTGKRLISDVPDETLWAKAAAAAKDVINLGMYKIHTAPFREIDEGQSFPKTIVPPNNEKHSNKNFPEGWKNIDPLESYRQLFNGELTASSNLELIFTRGVNSTGEGIQAMVRHQMPRSLNGWNTHGVTLKHVDTYYMSNGDNFPTYGNVNDPVTGRPTGFTQSATESLPLPAGVSKQYAQREPRFYASIAYNGSIWDCENSTPEENNRHKQIFYYRGSPDGRLSSAPGFYIRTGIGIKKFVHPLDYFPTMETAKCVQKIDPDIRYAEILLIYVEALNELTTSHNIPTYDGSGTIEVSHSTAEMSTYMTPIRVRAGLPDFNTDVYNDAKLLKKAIKRERQLELFAECHRYYDLRRWMDAAQEETQEVWGCNMIMTANQREQFHTPIKISSLPAVFVDKMYLWPISYDELRRNNLLTQNPGWTYYD